MVGREWPTSIVDGISRSATSLRNFSQDMVGANEPMPSVSKKLVMAPRTMPSMLGFARPRDRRANQDEDKEQARQPERHKQCNQHGFPPPAKDYRSILDDCRSRGYGAAMLDLDDQQQAARDWFEALRTRICAAFEEIEREAGSDAAFELHAVAADRPRRRARRRRRARADERHGVRKGRGQRLDRRRALLARVRGQHCRRRGRPALLRHRASASSPTWPTRTCPRCT